MKKLLTLLIILICSVAMASSITIDTPAFKMKLDGDWVKEQSQDSEQFSYYSKSLDVGLTISFVIMDAKPADTERIAKKLVEIRLNSENSAAKSFNLEMTIVKPIVVPFSKGHQVAYYGHDSGSRQFRYLGLVFPNKTVNIYVESKSKTQDELETIFNQLLKGLSFD